MLVLLVFLYSHYFGFCIRGVSSSIFLPETIQWISFVFDLFVGVLAISVRKVNRNETILKLFQT